MLAGPTIRRRRLGADLRRLREQRALRLDEVADQLGVAASTLSRIETGKAPTRTSYLTLMLDLYGVDDPAERRRLLDSARESQRRGWWTGFDDLLPAGAATYLGLEAAAHALRTFQALLVPGLMRTPGYSRAAIAATRPFLDPAQVERLVAMQMRRQEVLHAADPIRLDVVLDESVLLRSVAGPTVMREQLDHLAQIGGAPGVTIRVLRLATLQRVVPPSSFGILSFDEPGDADVACAEGIRGQVLLEQRDADVRTIRRTFDALGRAALTPPESADLIAGLAQSL